MDRIGVVDTMFARYDMGAEALAELASGPGHGSRFEVIRRTVPGFKDLGVAAKRLIGARRHETTMGRTMAAHRRSAVSLELRDHQPQPVLLPQLEQV